MVKASPILVMLEPKPVSLDDPKGVLTVALGVNVRKPTQTQSLLLNTMIPCLRQIVGVDACWLVCIGRLCFRLISSSLVAENFMDTCIVICYLC